MKQLKMQWQNWKIGYLIQVNWERNRPRLEYTNAFADEDGINCLIFKYKKNAFGKWLLGIVSESGTFSEIGRI